MYANKTNGSYVPPPSGTRVVEGKHPSQGGNPYPVELHQIVISMWENGEDLQAPRLMQLRHQRKFPSLSTCKRWIHQYQAEGNVLPMRALGNSFSTREVHRQDLINLVVYWMVRPKAYIDEVHAYVHNRNPANPPFSQSQIYRAELQLGLFRKAASTTSNLAYSHVNLFKCHEYWSQAFPDGVAGESMRDLIEIDGSGYRLNSQNCSFGKVTREKCCNAHGKYKNGNGGVNLLMAISGDERDGHFSFHKCYTKGWMDLLPFFDFMLKLCDWLAVNYPGRQFFVHDGQLEHPQAPNDHSFDLFPLSLCCVSCTVLVL
jgi:hypothetical protein